jgi:hypothetical protein
VGQIRLQIMRQSGSDFAANQQNWIQIRDDEKLNRYFSREVTSGNILDLLSIPGPFGSWVDICNELGEANYIRSGFPPKLPLSEIFREMKATSNYVQPVNKYIHSYRSLLENNIIVPDDVIIKAYVDRVGRMAELPLNEVFVTLPFLFDVAATRKQIYSSLVSIDPSWVFYYFSVIFVEKPRRSKESDMPVLSPEESGDLMAPKVIANLLFLWVLQGMNNDETKLNDQNMINGLYFLRKCINGHDQESKIIHQMRILFSKNEEWSKMIKPDGLIIWAGKSESLLQFIRRFH